MGNLIHKMIAILLLWTTAVQSKLDLIWAPGSRVDDNLIWEPDPPPGYYVIGQYVSRYAESRYLNERISNPDTRIPVARVINETDELAVPLDFEMMIDYHKMNFWNMICPENYVAMSGIATMKGLHGSERKPDINRYRCVNRRITKTKEIYFFIFGNGRYGLWAMPVTGNPIGSFYALAQPQGDSASTVGYQLVATPRTYIVPTVNGSTHAFEQTTRSPETKTTSIVSTDTERLTKSSEPSHTNLVFEPTNTTHIIIIAVSGTVIGISLIVVCIVICNKLRSRKSKSVLIRPLNNSFVSTEISGFVYQNAAPSPSGSISFNNNPLKPAREMRINMLYEETTPREMIDNALHNEVYPKTVQNPLYVSTKSIEINET